MRKDAKIIFDCLDEMYRNSEPSTTWKEIEKNYSGKGRTEFYLKHSITEEKYEEIRKKYMKKLSSLGKREFPWILLDYAPTFKR